MTDIDELKVRLRGGIFTYGDERAALAAIEAQEKEIRIYQQTEQTYVVRVADMQREYSEMQAKLEARIAELKATITAATIILSESGVPSEAKNEDAFNVLTAAISSSARAALNGEK